MRLEEDIVIKLTMFQSIRELGEKTSEETEMQFCEAISYTALTEKIVRCEDEISAHD